MFNIDSCVVVVGCDLCFNVVGILVCVVSINVMDVNSAVGNYLRW